MSAKEQTEVSGTDKAKLILAVGVFLAGVVGFYTFDDQSTLVRVLGMVAVAALALSIAFTSAQGRNAWLFAQEARQELRRVVWPTRTETLQTTLIVLVMVIIVAILLWLMDMFFMWGVGALVRPGG
ncbi:preprotein translocase subunit SecE [Spiribacter sp. 2438]|uniref:preprotein translocase subunit SecE n=1 Tax=Spiribacter sp. 2438 TaxID=2666185 RepID=UPI0012AFE095|nr:preprotein translocase subunit SecE [Spiribacter sp. 2438]QGM22280.1 preprotein translocase subunit SecE [Spiribacter sp. 2438]